MTIYLMSTTVIPGNADGIWQVQTISAAQARQYVHDASDGDGILLESEGPGTVVSAVGHESTAEAMAALLQVPVPMNRITVSPRAGDEFLCFRLNRRPPEGAILDRAQLEELGYGWTLMRYVGYLAPHIFTHHE